MAFTIVAASLLVSLVQCMQYITNSSLPSEDLSGNCATALTSEIQCNKYITRLQPGGYYSPAALTAICTSVCDVSLNEYQVAVQSACAGQIYNVSVSHITPISVIPDLLRYNYNRSCISDDGRWCNNIAYQAAIANDPTSPRSLGNGSQATGGAIGSCDNCFIKALQFQAGSPYYGGPLIASQFSSLTSSCSKTGFPLATSSFTFTPAPASPIPTPPCTGHTYTIQPGDDCHSISVSQGIGTSWLLQDNSLPAYCSQFPANGTLCIRNACKIYTVQTNDTCDSIARASNVTYSQILAWNPIFGSSCSNIARSVGDQVCVGLPGTPYQTPTTTFAPVTSITTAAPVPTDVANGTNHNCALYYKAVLGDYCNRIVLKFSISLDDFLFLNPELNANCTNLFADESYCVQPVGSIDQYPGHSGYIPPTSTISEIPYSSLPKATFVPPRVNVTQYLPIANGTRKDCDLFVDGSELNTDISFTFYTSVCDALVVGWGITSEELANWNPSLITNSTSCAPDPNYRYCMAAYDVTKVQPAEPTALPVYPIRGGAIANCTEYMAATGSITCQVILDEYKITIAQFYAWNPAVGPDCSNLWLGYQYCIRITNYTPDDSSPTDTTRITATPISGSTTVSASAFPTGQISPPGPTQSGQPSDCIEWHVAESGDTCTSIETEYNLSDSDFHAWNPAVSADCASGFWANYAYCVGISSNNPSRASSTRPLATTSGAPAAPTPTQGNSIVSGCNKYAQAQSGDWCAKFADRNGISTDQLYAWNRVLGSGEADCGNQFWAGYYYCVGVSG